MTDGISYELMRICLDDGEETTVYLVRHPRRTTSVRVVRFPRARRLDHWCADNAQPEAIVAGFFLRDPDRALGEVRIDGRGLEHEPITHPWGPKRGCVHIDDGVAIVRREQLAHEPAGELVQAGPVLVWEGRSLIDGDDREGFSAGASQIRLGHHDRALPALRAGRRRDGAAGGLL